MTSLFVGTEDGLRELTGEGEPTVHLAGHDVTAVARDRATWWAIVAGRELWRSDAPGAWDQVAATRGPRLNCLAATSSGLLVGTAEAGLLRLANGTLGAVQGFDQVDGRDDWYTPWGGPPDSRSIAEDPERAIYINVHVGGIVRSMDGGGTWEPTIEVDSDVHQVFAGSELVGSVLAATAEGLAVSEDAGGSWSFRTQGLHGTYCRAVAVSGGSLFVSASEGHRGRQAAVYRGALSGKGSFRKCERGLPEWFTSNIDSHCLAAGEGMTAFGTEDGTLYTSMDGGDSWETAASGLPAVRCVVLG